MLLLTMPFSQRVRSRPVTTIFARQPRSKESAAGTQCGHLFLRGREQSRGLRAAVFDQAARRRELMVQRGCSHLRSSIIANDGGPRLFELLTPETAGTPPPPPNLERRHLLWFCAVAAKKKIAVVPGDGIGKEVTAEAVKVLGATDAPLALTPFDWSADRYLQDGVTIPADGFTTLARDFDAILFGALGDPRVPSNIHAKEILLGMRFKMDLYANVRPVKLLDASLCLLKNVEPADVDFVVVRENTEGVYMDMGGVFKPGTPDEVATQEDINTRKGVERIIRFAFELAKNSAARRCSWLTSPTS